MMLRLAKTQNFVAVSPSIHQRAAMKAPESLPLIMEPESKLVIFYNVINNEIYISILLYQ